MTSMERVNRKVAAGGSAAAAHLGIDLREYDARIRTFIPGYERMLETVAGMLAVTVRGRSPLVVDLGTGTGALAGCCAGSSRFARFIGVDEDAGMLAAARRRMPRRLTAVQGSFEAVALPSCDAAIASLALHHIPTPARRNRLFKRIYRALRPGGALIIADCYLSSDRRLAAADRAFWLSHLCRSYTRREAAAFLRAWAKEDTYAPLMDDVRLLARAGFTADIVLRQGSFAVLVATKQPRGPSLRSETAGSSTHHLKAAPNLPVK